MRPPTPDSCCWSTPIIFPPQAAQRESRRQHAVIRPQVQMANLCLVSPHGVAIVGTKPHALLQQKFAPPLRRNRLQLAGRIELDSLREREQRLEQNSL